MGISPAYFVRIIELIDHAAPFLFPVFGDHCFLPVFALQVHAHPAGIGFGVELGADHVIGEADSHDGPFERNMRTLFFDGQDMGAHACHPVLVGLDHLVVAAVYGKERVLQTGEYGLILSIRLYMDGKDAEGRGFPAGDPGNAIMPADQLKGMTNKKDMFGYSLLRSGAIPGDR